jgi:hypothetical protein
VYPEFLNITRSFFMKKFLKILNILSFGKYTSASQIFCDIFLIKKLFSLLKPKILRKQKLKKAPRLLKKQKTVWKSQAMRKRTVKCPACPWD